MFVQIPDFPMYLVNQSGDVVSMKRGKWRPLKPDVMRNGYERLTLESVCRRLVHRIVATTFLPNPLNLPQVNHKDGNKLNNTVDNLEWCDAFHNMQHCERLGLKKNQHRGELSPSAKLSENEARWIIMWRAEGFKLREIARAFNIAEPAVSRICSGIRWAHLRGVECLKVSTGQEG